jgi:DNA-binding MarR family transcriptional regulator
MHIQVKCASMSIPSEFDLTGTGACASFNFRRTARAITRLFDLSFQRFGVRSTQFTILVGVAKSQPVSISVLGTLLVIDSTTLTRSLRLLEREGLLAISGRSTMRRRFVTLTPQGEQLLTNSLPAWRQAQQRFTTAIGQEYWANLQNELEREILLASAAQN